MTDRSASDARRRNLLRVGESPTKDQWRRYVLRTGSKCLCCGRPESPDNPLTRDHVVPLAQGGANDIGNLQPLCADCNNAKGETIADYREPRKRTPRKEKKKTTPPRPGKLVFRRG